MKRKSSIVALVIIFLAQTLFNGLGYPLKAQAAATDGVITKNILTSVVMKDQNGQVINAVENPDLHPKLGDALEISYTWELKNNHGYKAGAQFTFNLPAEFAIYNDIDPQPLIFNGSTVGTFTVSKAGVVTMTFNDLIEKLSDINGTLKLWTEFSEKLDGSVTKEIAFPVKDGEIVKIPVVFQPKPGGTIDKKGVPNKAYNADSIEWTVDFNKQLAKINQAILEDPIQAGQTLQPDSIKLYYLDVQLDGTVKQGAVVDPSEFTIEKTAAGGDFQIRFKADQIRSAYRVVYTTNTDMDQTSFVNEASLLGKNVTGLKAKATLTINRGTPLTKTASKYNSKDQTIEWTIKYNYNEKNIAKDAAVLTDYFNDSQTLVDGSFNVYKVILNADGTEKSVELVNSDQYTITPKTKTGQNGFEFQFLKDINAAYKIVYTTKSKDRVNNNGTITNNVDSGTGKHGSASQSISQGILVKTNKATYPDTDYSIKSTKWEITFNFDEYKMNNVELTDIFPNKGLTLIPDSLKIEKDVNGKRVALTKDVDYELIQTNQDQFILKFKNQITETHYISYQTKFDYDTRADSKKYFDNKATIVWTDEKGVDQTKEATASFTPDTYTQNNGFKNGSYNAVTKEITWNVGINYNLKTITKPVVEDYFLQGQELVSGSLKIYELALTGQNNGTKQGKELQLDTDYTVTKITDKDGNPGVRISFTKSINAPYFITYKTSLQGQLIQAQYPNTAVVYDDTKEVNKLTASVSITNGGKYTSKTGVQDNKVINWDVNINFGQSQLTHAKIIDNPSVNQIILEDSFHLYGTNVDTKGNVTKNPAVELKRDVDYKVDVTTDDQGKQSFTLQFLKAIDTAYILSYQSFIIARNGDTITNDVKLEAEKITTETTSSNQKVTVKFSSGSGTGSGETGSLEVTKVDAATGDVLKGATFTLYDSEGKIAIRTLTTGEDGKVTFSNLLYDDYILKEATAPNGYVVGINNSQKVTVKSKDNKVTIANKKIIRAVELTKVDNDNPAETLKGAVFALLYKVDNSFTKIAELETDEYGKIYRDQLDPGEYQLVEIKAPFGYKLDGTVHPFTIGVNQTEKITITAKNELSLGAVELVKHDKDHPEVTLSGATFDILNSSGTKLKTGLTTDKDGKIVVTDLKPGDYQFVETKAPFGYELDSKPISFTIVKGQVVVAGVTAYNELTTGSVELTKVDKDNEAWTLAGAEFKLEDGSGKIVKDKLSTDENGKIVVTDLKPGDYQFIETKAPFGYDLDSTPIKFTIVKGPTKAVKLTVDNQMTLGSVALTKVDKDHPEVTIADAEFALQDASSKTLQTKLISDVNGKIVVDNLKPGDYQFVETKAPFGYNLNSTPIKFTIVKGPTEVVKLTAINELITGSVELTKVDKDNPEVKLADAEFALQDEAGNNLQTGLVTDANGKLVINDLKPGTYQFVETKAPFGYDLDSTPIKFTIVKGPTEAVKLTVNNQMTLGSVSLTKVAKELPVVTIEGAEFALQDKEGKTLQTGLISDGKGKIVVNNLKPGDYQFVETKAPFGYNLNSTPIKFTIVKGPTEVVQLTAYNELTTGSVELTKVDKDNPEITLANAEFTLQDANGNNLQTGLVTDANGKLVINDLKPGHYQFVETKAPFGYDLDSTPVKFTIVKGPTEAVKLTVDNQMTLGSVSLTKVDKEHPEITLTGAEFALQDAAGKTLQTKLVSDENGKIVVNNLKPGDYQFVETKAPFGYNLDSTPIKFTIVKGPTEVVQLTAYNELTTGSVEVTKVDKDHPNVTLAGAEFTLQDADGNNLQTGLVTNANGKLVINDLKPGHYQFVETKAPTGYVLDATPIKFTIEKGQTKAATVIIGNAKQKVVTPDSKNPLANTASNIFNMILLGAGLMLAGLLLFVVRRKKSLES